VARRQPRDEAGRRQVVRNVHLVLMGATVGQSRTRPAPKPPAPARDGPCRGAPRPWGLPSRALR
jgi:hypothetical protein